MSNQLLPCPFCGGKADIESDDSDYPCHDAVCQECGARCHVTGCGPDDGWEWNRRATQPAAGEPVAHKLAAVQVNGEWKEVRGKWVDGAPIAEMLEGVEEGYLRVELAFSAQPAAAHGDEAVRKDSRVDDLATLVRRLVRSLWKASPDNDLSDKALDYLNRAGLKANPLRTVDDEDPWLDPAVNKAWDRFQTCMGEMLREDAKRYRWLRNRLPGSAYRAAGVVYSEGGEGVDEAIDAAMRAQGDGDSRHD